MSNIQEIIYIQKIYRGFSIRKKRLPIILYQIQKYLQELNIQLNNDNDDGRLNSINDEDIIKDLIINKFSNKIKIAPIRHWYDILIFDYFSNRYIPINIKTSLFSSADNSGNLSLCIQSYTNYKLDYNKSYNNCNLNKIFQEEVNNKRYNRNYNKDYYFIVVNKNDTNEIIINSVNKLSKLTGNLSNLPFQIDWKYNKKINYKTIKENIQLYIGCMKKPQESWKQNYINFCRNFTLDNL